MSAAEHLNPDQFHSFDVTVSDHDSLKAGVTEKRLYGSQHNHHRVTISGEYDHDTARLIAAQMATATHGYVTGVYTRI